MSVRTPDNSWKQTVHKIRRARMSYKRWPFSWETLSLSLSRSWGLWGWLFHLAFSCSSCWSWPGTPEAGQSWCVRRVISPSVLLPGFLFQPTLCFLVPYFLPQPRSYSHNLLRVLCAAGHYLWTFKYIDINILQEKVRVIYLFFKVIALKEKWKSSFSQVLGKWSGVCLLFEKYQPEFVPLFVKFCSKMHGGAGCCHPFV